MHKHIRIHTTYIKTPQTDRMQKQHTHPYGHTHTHHTDTDTFKHMVANRLDVETNRHICTHKP